MGRRGTREGEESLKFLGRSITPGNWRPGRWVLQQAGVRLGKRRRQKPGGGWGDRRPARGEEGLTSNRGKERMGRFWREFEWRVKRTCFPTGLREWWRRDRLKALSLGHFPWSWLLHKLPFYFLVSKLLERVVPLPSYFCPHATEMALAKITNDLTAKWRGFSSPFVLSAPSKGLNSDLLLHFEESFHWLVRHGIHFTPHTLNYFSKSFKDLSYSVNILCIALLPSSWDWVRTCMGAS